MDTGWKKKSSGKLQANDRSEWARPMCTVFLILINLPLHMACHFFGIMKQLIKQVVL